MELTEQQQIEFEGKIKRFEDMRKTRFSLFEGLFISLLASAIILCVDLIAEEDISLKILLIIALLLGSWRFYILMLRQTQKPVIALGNAIGTIEHGPVNIKGEDGQVYSVFRISDFIHEGESKK